MAPDELTLACRLSGLSLEDLWLRYLEVGGNRARSALASRLEGAPWPEADERYLSVVADEALRESGLPAMSPPPESGRVPAEAVLTQALIGAVLTGTVLRGDEPQGLPRTAAAVLVTHAHGRRLTALFERCARARADARGVRQHAASVRRERYGPG